MFGTLLKLVIVVVFGWWFTNRAVPWLYVRIMRALGFAAKMTPITRKRVDRFRRIRRGYWSFRLITTLYVTSLFLELIVNSRPLVISYDGRLAFPAVVEWIDKVVFFARITPFERASDFGQVGDSEVDYRTFARHVDEPSRLRDEIGARRTEVDESRAALAQPDANAPSYEQDAYKRAREGLDRKEQEIATLEAALPVFEEGRAWCLVPLYPAGPGDLRLDLDKNPPNPPSFGQGVPLGTDLSGRDIVPLLLYGFRISLTFALLVAACGYLVGVIVGGIMGYYGGWTDIIVQRVVEIWGSVPFLFTIMIIAAIVQPSLVLLVVLLVVLRSWMGITYYVRGEFYREKAKDYVQAAIGAGVSDWKIITRHILPNSLVPVVTFAPFGIVAYIGTLVSLDFLGFGLPPGTPSWGALLRMGLDNVRFYPHLVIVPTAALAVTLYCVVMIGEAVREAFDPKVFSRLR